MYIDKIIYEMLKLYWKDGIFYMSKADYTDYQHIFKLITVFLRNLHAVMCNEVNINQYMC